MKVYGVCFNQNLKLMLFYYFQLIVRLLVKLPAEHEVEHLRVVLLLELSEDLCGAAELAPPLLEAGVLEVDVQLVGQVVRGGALVHVADLGQCESQC